jgi:LPXTG-site transpeptidase (sortase) family protein
MRMVLAALLDDAPSEEELLNCLPRNPNPYLGFRGDPAGYNRFPDGTINWENYGAYAPAVAQTLNQCVLEPAGSEFEAVAVNKASYEQVADSVLDGYPVIVWVARRGNAETITIDTPEGPVRLVFGEHVWVVAGYQEDGTFQVHDPYPRENGVQTLHVRSFPNWDLFERMAVFVRPREAEPESRPTMATTRTPQPAAYSPPTRIRIPKINVDADVVEVGYEIKEENGELVTIWKVADFAAGFHRGSAYPGHPGNTIIAGHNNIRGRVFRHLLDLLPGDDIYLHVGEQVFHYAVTQQLLIKEKGVPDEIRRENAQWIQPTEDERLTLVSCWPFVKPDHRVVVTARPIHE